MRLWKAGATLFGLLFLLVPSSAQTEPPRVYGGGTFSPNQRVQLDYSLPSGGSNRIQILRVKNPEKLLELGGPRDFERTKELDLSLVRTVPVFRLRSNTYGTAQIGRLPEGLYVAQIGNPKPTSATLVLVTNLGLVTKSDPDTTLVYTANLTSGEPKESQVFVVKDKKVAQSARAIGGLAQIRTQFANNENLFVAARSGDSWAFSSAYWQDWNLENYRVYLTTDRPVYRPGQTVFFKGTIRKTNGLQPVAGEGLEVVVQDSNEAEIFSGKVTTDAYGSFSGQFESKLDARLGNYSLIARYKDEEHSGEFEIQEYVKPEYRVTATPDKTVHVQGEKARFVVKGEYLFGGPVSGGKVNYSVIQKPYYRFAYQSSYGFYQNYEYENSYDGSIVQQGQGRLNDKGELVVDVPLKTGEEDYRLTLEAGVSDESGREISGKAALTAYRSAIVMDISSTNYAYSTSEAISAKVRAQDLGGKPIAVPFSVVIKRYYWLRNKGEQTESVTTLQGRTDASGEAIVKFKLAEQGSYSLEVQAKDSAGRPTSASDYVWVSDGSYWYWSYKSVDIKPDKPEYKVGETAKFVIQSPISDGWALVNLEGLQVSQPEIIHFKGSTFTYQVKLTEAMTPNGYLAVTVLGNGEYYSDVAGFLIPPSEKFLNVAISTDKDTYEPGEEATYQIKVSDAKGNPVQTQLTLGLVDEAIYLVRPEKAPDIRGFFWAFKSNIVGTETAGSYYFGNVAPAPMMSARSEMDKAVFGQAKESAAKTDSTLATATVRQDFRDTALWLPSVETDAQGQATLKAKFPDNLTQWRMTARAISLSDKVGQNTQTVTTTLPVIARLATPRFLVKGDQASFKVIGQNNLSEAQNGETRLSVSGLELLTQSPIQALFPAKGRIPTVYQVKAAQTGTAVLEASALTPAASDALRTRLPVLPKGLKQELGWAGQSGDSLNFDLPQNADLTQAKATLYLNPSLATAVTPALAYLAGYPYGCSEQTMSRFLPSVLAKQAGDFVTLPQNISANLDDFVAVGLKRLYDFQHEDGGWGFWQNDSSSLYISSYVLTGLLQAKEAGYEIRQEVVKRGVEYLLKTLNRDETFASDAVAYAGYAFAMAGPDYLPQGSRNGIFQAHTPRLRKAAFQQKEPLDLGYLDDFLAEKDLTPYGHALIVLAFERNGDKPAAERALDSLLTKLTQRDRVAYWNVSTYQWAWNDDRIEATARGLEALAKLRPDHPAIPKIANWLMLERKGARWISTKDTAAVVVAALELAKARGETAAEQQVSLKINGQEQTVTVGPKGLEVPLNSLQVGSNSLEVSGDNPFFASAGVSYFEEKDYLNIESKGFRVGRQYEKLTARFDAKNDRYVYDRSPLPRTLKVGDLVAVTLSLRPDAKNTRYVLLEEPLPAGLAVVENDDSFRIAGVKPRYGEDYYGWNYWFDGREIRDSRLEFYFSYLSGPVTFTYILRAETPGTFTALPSAAWMMYEPEVRGTGTVRTLSVSE